MYDHLNCFPIYTAIQKFRNKKRMQKTGKKSSCVKVFIIVQPKWRRLEGCLDRCGTGVVGTVVVYSIGLVNFEK